MCDKNNATTVLNVLYAKREFILPVFKTTTQIMKNKSIFQ